MFTLRPYLSSNRRMLKSLKNRLLAWFLLIAFAIASIVFPLNYFHKKEEIAIRNVVDQLNTLHIYYIKDLKSTSEFLAYEINNPDFFITGESPYLTTHNHLSDSLFTLIAKHTNKNYAFSPIKKEVLFKIESTYAEYCDLLDSIVYNIYKRGYRDLGLEGEMISYVYPIEKNPNIRSTLIEIRKNEREYLNRNDSVYAKQVVVLTNNLIKSISNNKYIPTKEKRQLIAHLTNYLLSFNKLTSLDKKLGLKANNGFKTSLYTKGEILFLKQKILKTLKSQD